MRTNIDIEDSLISKAMAMSKIKTKKDVVNKALEEYIKLLQRQKLLQLKGRIEFFDEEGQ
jgi:Arc/MetJ family transcription regulator